MFFFFLFFILPFPNWYLFPGIFLNSRKHDDASISFLAEEEKSGGNGRRWCLREDVKFLNEKKKFTFEENILMKSKFLLPVFFGKRKWIRCSKLCFIIDSYEDCRNNWTCLIYYMEEYNGWYILQVWSTNLRLFWNWLTRFFFIIRDVRNVEQRKINNVKQPLFPG